MRGLLVVLWVAAGGACVARQEGLSTSRRGPDPEPRPTVALATSRRGPDPEPRPTVALATIADCPSAGGYRELGERRLLELRYREAEAALQRAVELDPGDQRARDRLDRTRWILGERTHSCLSGVTSCPTFSVARVTEECRAHLCSARAHLDAGRPDQALARCERVHEALRWFPFALSAEPELRAEARALLEEAWPPP